MPRRALPNKYSNSGKPPSVAPWVGPAARHGQRTRRTAAVARTEMQHHLRTARVAGTHLGGGAAPQHGPNKPVATRVQVNKNCQRAGGRGAGELGREEPSEGSVTAAHDTSNTNATIRRCVGCAVALQWRHGPHHAPRQPNHPRCLDNASSRKISGAGNARARGSLTAPIDH